MISGAANGGVRVWDVVSGECLQHLRGHVKSVTAVTCTAEHLLSVSLESVLCIWDRGRGECLHRLKQVSKGDNKQRVYNREPKLEAKTLGFGGREKALSACKKWENASHVKTRRRNLQPAPEPVPFLRYLYDLSTCWQNCNVNFFFQFPDLCSNVAMLSRTLFITGGQVGLSVFC